MFKYLFNTFPVVSGVGYEFTAYGKQIGLRYSCDGWTNEFAAEFVRHLNARHLSHSDYVPTLLQRQAE